MKQNISIITVSFNDCENLERTIQSVLNQSYKTEYIVVDGKSSDETITMLEKYKSSIDQIIIEKDKGLYDAMNKGVRIASKEWLLFLNSGDEFHNDKIIENTLINNMNNFNEYEVIYGDTILLKKNNKKKYLRSSNIRKIIYGMPFCHQSVFIKKEVHKKMLYETKYKFAADYNFFVQSYFKNIKFYKIESVISAIRQGGLSDVNRIPVLLEWFHIIREKSFYGSNFMLLRILLEILKYPLKRMTIK